MKALPIFIENLLPNTIFGLKKVPQQVSVPIEWGSPLGPLARRRLIRELRREREHY